MFAIAVITGICRATFGWIIIKSGSGVAGAFFVTNEAGSGDWRFFTQVFFIYLHAIFLRIVIT